MFVCEVGAGMYFVVSLKTMNNRTLQVGGNRSPNPANAPIPHPYTSSPHSLLRVLPIRAGLTTSRFPPPSRTPPGTAGGSGV